MLDILKEVADSLYGNIGDVCFDSVYLSREICNLISETGGIPYIKLKSNTMTKSKGSFICKKIVLAFMKNRGEFDAHYHQRSIVVAVFAAPKEQNGRGGSLRSHRTGTQDRGLAGQTASYNIDMGSRAVMEKGVLAKNMLKAMAAN